MGEAKQCFDNNKKGKGHTEEQIVCGASSGCQFEEMGGKIKSKGRAKTKPGGK